MWFKHHFRKYPTKINSIISIENVNGILSCLKRNTGLGVVPSHLIEKDLETGRLVQISKAKTEFVNKLVLTQLLERRPNLTEKIFIEFCEKKLEERVF